MTLIPANGISSRRFAAWMDQKNMNTINDLMEMGFIHPKNNREILLHPMIREVAVEELKPSVCSCSVLLDSLQEISLMHGLDFKQRKTNKNASFGTFPSENRPFFPAQEPRKIYEN